MQEWMKRTVTYTTGRDITYLFRTLPQVHPGVSSEERKYPDSELYQISEATTDGLTRLINWKGDWSQYIVRMVQPNGEAELKAESSQTGLKDDNLTAGFRSSSSNFNVLYLPHSNNSVAQVTYSNEKLSSQKDLQVFEEVKSTAPGLLIQEIVSIYQEKGDDLFGSGEYKKYNFLTLEEKVGSKKQLFKSEDDASRTEEFLFRTINSEIEAELTKQKIPMIKSHQGLIFWLVLSGIAEIPDKKIAAGFDEIAQDINTYINAALVRTMFMYNSESVSSERLSLTLKPSDRGDRYDVYSNNDESNPPSPITTLGNGDENRIDIYKIRMDANDQLWDFSVTSFGRLRLEEAFRFNQNIDLPQSLDDLKNPDPEVWKKVIDSSPVRYVK
jgi:hypothetical protein